MVLFEFGLQRAPTQLAVGARASGAFVLEPAETESAAVLKAEAGMGPTAALVNLADRARNDNS